MIEALQRRLHRLIQVYLWGIDVHPTARVHPTALIDRTWPRGVHIEARCVIDEQAVLLTHDMTRGIYLDTRLGEGSHMGARSILMPGVTVGPGSVIAPGAVVTRDVPAASYAIGNPAEIRDLADG